ncbi:hypothetical protein [Rhodovulum strictum]|uniref:Uncharacterized protein n=1 Tax=Rhodovulum strictum TaxID=58314 RepID=A0A844BI29_9RHOB|nr:hypothetical protein [Rhodovulum strictum]MRH20712.1 hypothetical protein [Rhodovulum strictum]
MMLGDLPALRLAPAAPPAPDAGFADAQPVSQATLTAAARATGSDHVILIAPDIAPARAAETLMPDPALVAAGLCLGYPARSVVSGMAVPQGLRLIPVARLEDGAPPPPPALLVPQIAGTLAANDTPQRAFHTGFELTAARPLPPPGAARDRAALAASLGADALNGVWWVLGNLHSLLGRGGVRTCWAETAPLLSDPSAPVRRIRELARLVRLETGLPVQALDRHQSRALKAMLPPWAPPEMWSDFLRALADLGAAGPPIAARYTRAAAAIWPAEPPGPG